MMLVICNDSKKCSLRYNCPHAKLHVHNSISYQKCVNVKDSACYCSIPKSEIIKNKLKNINENMHM